MIHKWSCPLCESASGYFERSTEYALAVATASHIITAHEDRASLRAVNSARLHCTEIKCSLGMDKVYDSSAASFVPKLTEYDRKFLCGNKIKVD
jgi:hypothetical protein